MDFDFENESVTEIKNRFVYTIDNLKFSSIYNKLYVQFIVEVMQLKIREKLVELKRRVNDYKGTINSEMKVEIENLQKLSYEYNEIVQKAEDDSLYYKELFFILEYRYEQFCEREGKSEFFKMCKSILDARVQDFIRYIKHLIIINDKLKYLFSSFSF